MTLLNRLHAFLSFVGHALKKIDPTSAQSITLSALEMNSLKSLYFTHFPDILFVNIKLFFEKKRKEQRLLTTLFVNRTLLETRNTVLANMCASADLNFCIRKDFLCIFPGCEGGFPYLVSGKYAQDFGVVEEHCYPYLGVDTSTCAPAKSDCTRHYVAKYEYVGGYYGACSEAKMMEDLVAYGPLAVAIEVYLEVN